MKRISDEAFELAMKSLDRDFGGQFAEKGLKESEYKSIPTGHPDLDSILTYGDGGIFIGGVCEVFGNEGGGKCLVRDTMCLTPKGFMTIEEIFNEAGHQCDSARGFVEAKVELINGQSKVETTSYFYKNGYGPTNLKTIRITTKDGFTIEGTHKHPVLVMNESGFVVWKHLGRINKDDFICISRGMGAWGDSVDPDEAAFLGYLIAEGGLTELPKAFCFTNNDPAIVKSYKYALEKSLGSSAVQDVKQYDNDYRLMFRKYGEKVCSQYGLVACRSTDKEMPSCILRASKKSQASFIRAYFDGDGSFQFDKMNLQFCSASLELLRKLQLMLLNFGIYSHVTSTYNRDYDRDYYELELAGMELKRYCDEIGFNNNKKCDKIVLSIKMLGDDRAFNTNIDTIPHQRILLDSLYASLSPEYRTRKTSSVFNDMLVGACELTYLRLLKVIDVCDVAKSAVNTSDSLLMHFQRLRATNYIYSSVVDIEHSINRTYDFTLPETHSFWSNGMISHNSSLAMRMVGQAQKLGLHCAWVDVEYSFTPQLAQLNGVDTDKLVQIELLKGKEDDVEFLNIDEVLNKIQRAVWSGVFSLIVVDSVAAFMSEQVAASDFDPNKKEMGAEARAMSRGLRRIVPACAEKECTVIFINQIRVKIGEVYGNPETTPGGRALKFYANQRISVHKSDSKKQLIYHKDEEGNDELAGHYARVRVVKNRKNKPYYDALEIPIYYKEYFPDNAKICYDLARKLQVIKTKNGILTWKHDGSVVYSREGESEMLSFIRGQENKEPKEVFLAHCCIEAAESEKNKKKKVPVQVPSSIAKLAVSYSVQPKKKSRKETTPKIDDLDA